MNPPQGGQRRTPYMIKDKLPGLEVLMKMFEQDALMHLVQTVSMEVVME